MTTEAWSVVGVVAMILFGIVGIYFGQKQSANAAADLRQKAIDAATAPLHTQIAELRQDLRDRELRINQLEDQLRGGRK